MYDELPTVYFQVHALPLSRWPGRVRRRRGVTLVWIQPGTLKAHALLWARDQLSEAERLAVRLHYGETTDLNVPVRDHLLEGELTAESIPMSLRLPRERFALRSA